MDTQAHPFKHMASRCVKRSGSHALQQEAGNALPMGPAPRIATDFPGFTSPRRQAWMPLLSGSTIAPSSYETLLGSLKQKSQGWSMYRARDPCTGGVAKNLMSGSRLYLPALHTVATVSPNTQNALLEETCHLPPESRYLQWTS